MPKAIVIVALIKEDKTWEEVRIESDGANLYNVFQNAEDEARMNLGDDLPKDVMAITAIRAEWLDAEEQEDTEWEWHNGEMFDLPEELRTFRIQHYKDIFKGWWERVDKASTNAGILILRERWRGRVKGPIVAGCVMEHTNYFTRFKDFVVLPEHRGKGYARKMMEMLASSAKTWDRGLLANREKPKDIDMMYLRSLIYLDADGKGPEFEFGKFLRKMGFTPQPFNRHQLTEGEVEALDAYTKLYPESVDDLRIFTKMVVDNGVTLKPESEKELQSLTAGQWETAMGALKTKLDNFERSGRVSYRYDLCDVCKSMASDEQDSENCKKCYIHTTCTEPFREQCRFKEDYLISAAYFNEMKRFMESHRPEGE